MPIREIAQLGDPVLRLQAQPVNDVHDLDIQQLIATMQDTLSNTQGVGIAAPQIGESKQIIIVASRPTSRYPSAPLMDPTVMINPAFKSIEEKMEKDWEGCLSIPGIRALVPRYAAIVVSYTDQVGYTRQIQLDGFVSRIFQHEFDHLIGKTYLDRVEDNRDIYSEREFLKVIENHPRAD